MGGGRHAEDAERGEQKEEQWADEEEPPRVRARVRVRG